ncbi:MAG: hypothetical protein ACI8PQ_000836 [Planctomycetota bacterium]
MSRSVPSLRSGPEISQKATKVLAPSGQTKCDVQGASVERSTNMLGSKLVSHYDALARRASMDLPLSSPFDDACAKIRVAYDELGHDLGWRFLTSPSATLDPKTEIALITLNPGGDRDRPDHARESSEAG